MNCKSVLLITSEFPPGPGGIGNHAFCLAKSLGENGYNLRIITNLENADKEETVEILKNMGFDEVVWVKRYGFTFFTYLKRLLYTSKFVITGRPKYCICTGKFSLWTGALLKIFGSKINTIAIVHGSEVNFPAGVNKWLVDKSLLKFDHIVAVSHFTKSLLSKEILKNIDISVIPNGIRTIHFNSTKEENKVITGFPKLLTVGNLTRRKGQHNMIACLPFLLPTFGKIHYVIAGLPSLKHQIFALTKSLQLESHVSILGKVTDLELQQLYHSCDIFVMLSESQSNGDVEGFGIAILEANYFGMPAIGSKGCGIEDAIEHGETGFLVDSSNPEEISSAINTIVNNYEMFSNNAREWAKLHDWTLIVKKYEEILKK